MSLLRMCSVEGRGPVRIAVGHGNLRALAGAAVAPDDRVDQHGVGVVGDGQTAAEGVADSPLTTKLSAIVQLEIVGSLYQLTDTPPPSRPAPLPQIRQLCSNGATSDVLVGAAEVHAAAGGHRPVVREDRCRGSRTGELMPQKPPPQAADAAERRCSGPPGSSDRSRDWKARLRVNSVLADRSGGIDRVDAAAVVGHVVGDVAVDDHRRGTATRYAAADGGVAVLDRAADEDRRRNRFRWRWSRRKLCRCRPGWPPRSCRPSCS